MTVYVIYAMICSVLVPVYFSYRVLKKYKKEDKPANEKAQTDVPECTE